MAPLSMIAGGATIAPRVEILTMLACDQLRPEYTAGHGMEDLGIHPWGWTAAPVVPAVAPAQTHFGVNDYSDNAHDVEFVAWDIGKNGTLPPNPQLCKSDPVVQAGVAKLQAGMFLRATPAHAL
jgi:hypothetical protein